MTEWLFALMLALWLGPGTIGLAPANVAAGPRGSSDLDRVTLAVEGAESSYGRDPLMWQPRWAGPQGPMQVTHAAARDVGGGNRFDPDENRQIGRAYLAGLWRRYGNWADAVAAYNWGPGNLDRWIAAGRPPETLSLQVRFYLDRVRREFWGRSASATPAAAAPPAEPGPPPPPEIRDAKLHQAFARNADAIRQIRDFLNGGGDAAGIAGLMRRVSVRPGYEEFKSLKAPNPAAAAGVAEMARVLLDKLQLENAAIAIVDEHRRGKPR